MVTLCSTNLSTEAHVYISAPADHSGLFMQAATRCLTAVQVFGRVPYFSLLQWYGAFRNDPWDALQKQTFLAANTLSPYRLYIQGESVEKILILSRRSDWPRKRSCRSLTSVDTGRDGVWLYTDSLVESVEISHSDSVRVHVSDS